MFVLLLLLLVVLGAGIGALVDDETGEGPPVVTVTPTETPADGGDETTTETPTEPTSPTETETETPSDGDSTPATDTPTATATPTDDEDDAGSGGSSGSGGSGGSSGSGGSGSGGDGGASPSVRLETVGSTAILNYSHVAPEDSGRDTVVLRNGGTRAATLSIANVSVTDHENGIVPPEAAVDSTPEDGELSEYVMLVVEARGPDGTAEHLYGTDPDNPRSLRAIGAESDPAETHRLGPDEEATITVDWHIPGSTGNVIQSDGAEVGVTFRLYSE